jgi:hypothetical protein
MRLTVKQYAMKIYRGVDVQPQTYSLTDRVTPGCNIEQVPL